MTRMKKALPALGAEITCRPDMPPFSNGDCRSHFVPELTSNLYGAHVAFHSFETA